MKEKEKEQFQNAFLHLVDYGYPAVVKKMIKYVDVKKKSAGLFLAVDKGDAKIVKILLKSGVDINVKEDFYGNTALIRAVNNGDNKIVKLGNYLVEYTKKGNYVVEYTK